MSSRDITRLLPISAAEFPPAKASGPTTTDRPAVIHKSSVPRAPLRRFRMGGAPVRLSADPSEDDNLDNRCDSLMLGSQAGLSLSDQLGDYGGTTGSAASVTPA